MHLALNPHTHPAPFIHPPPHHHHPVAAPHIFWKRKKVFGGAGRSMREPEGGNKNQCLGQVCPSFSQRAQQSAVGTLLGELEAGVAFQNTFKIRLAA